MRKICGYLIEEKLDQGGMSVVYKARAPITNRVVALKMLHPRDDIFIDLVGEERLREIFIEEARIMGAIHHENVAKVIACHEDGEAPIIVLEYFSHSLGSLVGDSTRVKNSRVISINSAYQYIHQTLCGLERLHLADIVHRDIKPHNLMIAEDDRVKIIDFGLCMVCGEERMHIPGMQVGSPYYTAPEQEKNPREADKRSDLYSVGVIAYRLLTGRLSNHREGSIPPPSRLNNCLTSDWNEFLLKSIQIMPQDRHQSASEMRLHLEELHTHRIQQPLKKKKIEKNDLVYFLPNRRTLRTRPGVLSPRQLQERLNLDALMRPRSYSTCVFEFVGTRLLQCPDTGLLWQRQGAGFPLNRDNTYAYIDYLNDNAWQGYDRWRLPTVEELATLLLRPGLGNDCSFGPPVAQDIHWVWSCDTGTKSKIWVVDILECYFLEVDKDTMASVCAVVAAPTPE